MSELAVWMYGEHVATLSEHRAALQLSYTRTALAMGAGRPLLSVSMPVGGRAFFRGSTPHAFFNGLLPEGEARRMIAYDFGVGSGNVFGLLEALGRDCAGALVVVPPGETPAPEGGAEPISDAEVAERLRKLRSAPLGVDGRVRVSLAGVQEKLLLARTTAGWALPVDGAPSTHILKPAHPLLRDSIANEAFCMRTAHHLGMPVAPVELARLEDKDVLVVARYDRMDTGDRVVRLHQEDLCQAHGLEPERKYEATGGPSLRQCAKVLRDWTQGDEDLYRLVDLTVLHVVLGNADAHAKNVSLLHDPSGRISLAPAYDLMSTTYYPETSTAPGMLVNGRDDLTSVTREDLVNEGVSWGLPRQDVEQRVSDLLDRLPAAVEAAGDEIGPPAGLARLVVHTAERLRQEPSPLP